jgi:hypothetical protein
MRCAGFEQTDTTCEGPPPWPALQSAQPLPSSTGPLQAELLLRCDELRDVLWALCDARADAAEAERARITAGGAGAEAADTVAAALGGLAQVEVDRFLGTVQFLQVRWPFGPGTPWACVFAMDYCGCLGQRMSTCFDATHTSRSN